MTTIEAPEGEEALTELILFHDRVYEGRSAWWPSITPIELPMLTGDSPFAAGRTFRPERPPVRAARGGSRDRSR